MVKAGKDGNPIKETRRIKGFVKTLMFPKDGKVSKFKIFSLEITQHSDLSKVGNVITCKGNSNFSIEENDELTIEGVPEYDKTYKSHYLSIFKVEKSKYGMNSFIRLASKIHGVGPVKARNIYECAGFDNIFVEIAEKNYTFPTILNEEQGKELIRIVKNYIENRKKIDSLDEIEGLTDFQLNSLKDFFEDNMELKDVRECIYDMTSRKGFGFLRVDDIALKLGIGMDCESRINCGIMYAMKDARQNGSTITNTNDLTRMALKYLKLKFETIKPYFEKLLNNKTIIKIGAKNDLPNTEFMDKVIQRFKYESRKEIRDNLLSGKET